MEHGSGSVDVAAEVGREENGREETPIAHLGSELVEGVAKGAEEVALAVAEDREAEVPMVQPPDSVSATLLVVPYSEPAARGADPVQSEVGEDSGSPGDAPPPQPEPPISPPKEGSSVASHPSETVTETEESMGSLADAPPPPSEPPISQPEEGSGVVSTETETEESMGSPGDGPPPPSEPPISKTQLGGLDPVQSETDQSVGTLGDALPLPSETPISNPPPASVNPTESDADESTGTPGDAPPASSDHPISELHVEERDAVQSVVHGDALPAPSELPILEPQPGTEDALPVEADEAVRIPEEQPEKLIIDELHLLSSPISEGLTQAHSIPVESIEKVVSREDAPPTDSKQEFPSVADDATSEQPEDHGLNSHLDTERQESKGITEVARSTHFEHRASWIGCCALFDVIKYGYK